ncbi:hypothetical protein BDV18DRAFT_161697 [Aspergillus unguis]
MSTTPIQKTPEMGTCTLSLAITPPESVFGGRWLIVLEFPQTSTYTAYYATGSPYRENPYDYETVKGNLDDQASQLALTTKKFIGLVQEERLRTFLGAFLSTAPGPDQFFAMRFLHALWKEGLVEAAAFKEVLNMRGEYSKGEIDYFYGNLCKADLDFFRFVLGPSGWDLEDSDEDEDESEDRGQTQGLGLDECLARDGSENGADAGSEVGLQQKSKSV